MNHRILEKLTQCPVIWNHIQLRLIEEWVQDSSRSVSSMPLLTQGRAPFPSVEIAAVSSDNGERVWRFHIVFTRSSSVNAMTDLDTGKRSTVCRTTSEDMFNKGGVSLTPGYHWVVQVLRNRLSVCLRPHVCTLPTSARYPYPRTYPWISSLSIIIVCHYFRVVDIYVLTLRGCFVERDNTPVKSLTTFNSVTKMGECSLLDLSW